MAGSTLRAYASGKRRYLDFCQRCGLQPLPLSESMLLHFVAYLASSGLSYQTVWLYLSAVRHLQILCIGRDPSLEAHPLLNYVPRGLHTCPVGKKPRSRLPITPAILQKIFQLWSRTPHQFKYILLWAAFCLGFFGFMRSGEFTCPSMSAFTSDMLTAQDILVDSRAHPSYIVVRLKRSKNDPFAVGTRVCIGATNQSVCPVTALLGYLTITIRLKRLGPLFIFQDGSTLSRERLVSSFRQVLADVGVSTARTAFVSVLRPRRCPRFSHQEDWQMEIIRVYALHSHFVAAAGRHLIVASAEG